MAYQKPDYIIIKSRFDLKLICMYARTSVRKIWNNFFEQFRRNAAQVSGTVRNSVTSEASKCLLSLYNSTSSLLFCFLISSTLTADETNVWWLIRFFFLPNGFGCLGYGLQYCIRVCDWIAFVKDRNAKETISSNFKTNNIDP